MNLVVFIYMVLLFVVLTPGILLSLPSGASKKIVALTHGIVFSLIWWLTHRYVWELSLNLEGMTSTTSTSTLKPKGRPSHHPL
jgi:hypothetical protein